MSTTPITELKGISPAAVVSLNRIGIVTLQDLLEADFDRIAYLLDSYDEAESLIRHAMSAVGGMPSRRTRPRPQETLEEPPEPQRIEPAHVEPARIGSRAGSPAERRPATPPTPPAHVPPTARAPAPVGTGTDLSRLGAALAAAIRAHASEIEDGLCLPRLMHRLGAASLAMEHGADEDHAIAAMLYAEADADSPDPLVHIRRDFGEPVAEIIERVAELRVVPMSPSGSPPPAYLAAVRASSPAVRTVLTADVVQHIRALATQVRAEGDSAWRRFAGGRHGTLWYYRMMLEALRAAGRTPLLDELDAALTDIETSPA
jgi:hypothetical protein